MSMSRLKCPTCGAVWNVDAAKAGTKARCLRCGGMTVVPSDAEAAPAPRARSGGVAGGGAAAGGAAGDAAAKLAVAAAKPPAPVALPPRRKWWASRKALFAGGAVLAAIIAVVFLVVLRPGAPTRRAKAKPRTRPARAAVVA